jgi:signal transduction histidine kinase
LQLAASRARRVGIEVIRERLLTERRLRPALDALAARVPVPVTLDTDSDERIPAPVKVATYFAVSEALANVAKYAQATEASVAVRRDTAA